MVAGLGLSTASMLGGCGVAQPEGVVRFNDPALIGTLQSDYNPSIAALGPQDYRTYFTDAKLTNRDMVELSVWAADRAINQDQQMPDNFLFGLQSAISDRWQKQPEFLRNAIRNSSINSILRGSPADPKTEPERFYSQLITAASVNYMADHYLSLVIAQPKIISELKQHENLSIEDQIAIIQQSYNRDPAGFVAKYISDLPGSLDEAHKTAQIHAGMIATAQSVGPKNFITPTPEIAARNGIKLQDIILLEQPFADEPTYNRVIYRKGEEIRRKIVGFKNTYEYRLSETAIAEIEAINIDKTRRENLAQPLAMAAQGNIGRLRIDPMFLPQGTGAVKEAKNYSDPYGREGRESKPTTHTAILDAARSLLWQQRN